MAPTPMTAADFRQALRDLNIRQRWLAAQLGVALSTVSHWATGKAPVAPYVPFVLALLRERTEIAARLSNKN